VLQVRTHEDSVVGHGDPVLRLARPGGQPFGPQGRLVWIGAPVV